MVLVASEALSSQICILFHCKVVVKHGGESFRLGEGLRTNCENFLYIQSYS